MMKIPSGPRRVLVLLLAVLEGLFLPVSGVIPQARADATPQVSPIRIDRGDFDLGLEVALAVAREVGISDDQAEIKRIYDIGSRVALAADDPVTVLTFYVVPMDVPNAFAVPGGFVFITQGLLDTEISDDAVAYLLGHEITHVRNRHSARMGTWSAITSLLQTAAMVGLAIGASRVGGGTATRTTDDYGVEQVSVSGAQAALQGSAIFSSVFRELFLRGFSRKLETEADEVGYRLATRAGYDPAGSVELLETLHQRIYEDTEYGYWRTHPYFTDRATAARARVGPRLSAPDSASVANYRLRAQATLVDEARRHDGATANLLFRAAARAGPGQGAEAEIELELVRFRLTHERHKPVVAQRLRAVQVEADSAIARLTAAGVDDEALDSLRGERKLVTIDLDENLPVVLRVIDSPGAASNETLEIFLENYADHDRAPGVRLALARRYLHLGRANAAAPLLAVLAHDAAADSLHDEGHEELLRALDDVTDPAVCYAIVDAPPDTAIAQHARVRMRALVADLDSLEVGGRFLREWPETPYTGQVEERVASLATDTARFARVYEAGGKPQEALDLYNRVVLLAPRTPAAAEAMRGIKRIQGIRDS